MGELEDRINSVLGDPDKMAEISRLAQTLMGGGQESRPENSEAGAQFAQPSASGIIGQLGLDADSLSKIGRILGASGDSGSNSQALIEAMKPYLSDKRKKKMDKAMKLARLAKLAGLAMGEMGGKGDD